MCILLQKIKNGSGKYNQIYLFNPNETKKMSSTYRLVICVKLYSHHIYISLSAKMFNSDIFVVARRKRTHKKKRFFFGVSTIFTIDIPSRETGNAKNESAPNEHRAPASTQKKYCARGKCATLV